MNVLVACEESQAVCIEFQRLGHNAFSCDLKTCSGGHPEWHIQGDVIPLLNGNCPFFTSDGSYHYISGRWDLIIAFPPCTYLTVTGNSWFDISKYGDKAIERFKSRDEAISFFLTIANADCDRIVIENPVGVMSTFFRLPDQIIQPYYFGDPFEKRTCLWLKGVPVLYATDIVDVPGRVILPNGKSMASWYADSYSIPLKDRSAFRSKTFPGIAKAMAFQWSDPLFFGFI